MLDARMHISELRHAAARSFPNTPLTELVVAINQSVVPPTYGVQELKTYRLGDGVAVSENEEARNAALIEKAQAHPDKYTIIDMTIAGGAALQKVMTLATGGFWDFDEGLFRFQGRNTYDAEQPREQESFQEALSWVFQAAEEFEQMDLRGRMKMLGVKVSRIRASEIV